jgi:hypothetical protein
MVNSILSSMPTFYVCAIKVLTEILNQVDKYRCYCLWKRGNINSKKPHLTAWNMVTKQKMKGVLEVINLRLQNDALLLKNLQVFQ